MTVHLYMSLIPEALIASMLPPEEFGSYYSVGSKKKTRGQAMFFELDPDFRHEFFDVEQGIARCVPHEDGSPKKSVYISTYRVLEHIPLTDVKTLYLVTKFGETLPLERSYDYPSKEEGLYMYQEVAPKNPLVVSTLEPVEMYRFLTQDPSSLIHIPAICFVELRLGGNETNKHIRSGAFKKPIITIFSASNCRLVRYKNGACLLFASGDGKLCFAP